MKSIFAARQKYWSGKMTKEQFNHLVLGELANKSTMEMLTLEPHWRWLSHVAMYFEFKHLGYE